MEGKVSVMAYYIFIPSICLATVVLGLAFIRSHLKHKPHSRMLNARLRKREQSQVNRSGAYIITE